MARPPRNLDIGIQYMGLPGVTRDCEVAVIRLIQCGEPIERVRILSHAKDHCLLLTVGPGDLIAIKSGFGSGYGGEGPHSFSYVLQLLEFHGASIEEYEVTAEFFERVDSGALTVTDIGKLEKSRPVRPRRYHDYIDDTHFRQAKDGTLWQEFPLLIPLAVVDSRLADLAKSFWDGPAEKLLKAHIRLEDIVRKRIGSKETGTRLFAQAFAGDSSKLVWKGLDGGEQAGRANLFTGLYMAYRNPRAHREAENDPAQQLTEFLLLNQLYSLERRAEKRRRSSRPKRL